MPDAAANFLDRLDAAIGCQQCGGPLGESPSDDFCCELCSARWHGSRAVALPVSTPLEHAVSIGVDVQPFLRALEDAKRAIDAARLRLQAMHPRVRRWRDHPGMAPMTPWAGGRGRGGPRR